MARIVQSDVVKRGNWPIAGGAGEVKVQRGILALDTVALVATDVLEAVVLPAGHVPVDFRFDTDDLDSTTNLTLDAGLITGQPGDTTFANRVVGQQIGAALTTAQGAAVYATQAAAFNRIAAQAVHRSVGFKVVGTPATTVRTGTFTVNRGFWKPGETYTANDYLILPNGVWMQCTTGGISGTYGQTDKDAPTQMQPNWNFVFAGTTTDGSAVWTCRSPIMRVQMMYAPALFGL